MPFKEYSFWDKTTNFKPADITIIGGGIVGLTCSIFLKKHNKNLNITILEKELIGTCATTKNAGFLCLGSPTELLDDISNYGENLASANLSARWNGVQMLFKLLGKKVIDFKLNGGYDLINEEVVDNNIQENIILLNGILERITKIPNFYSRVDLDTKNWGFKGFASAYSMEFEGQVNPANLLKALRLKAINLGVNIINGIEYVSHTTLNNEVVLNIGDKFPNIVSRKIVFSTNGFAGNIFKNNEIIPGRGQVLITKPISNIPFKGNFHFDSGYYYFRNVGNRILFGGGRNSDFENEKTTLLANNESIIQILKEKLENQILGHPNFEIDFTWAGIMGFTATKQPIVKQLSDYEYIAAGLNGMGMAMGTFIGHKASKMIIGKV